MGPNLKSHDIIDLHLSSTLTLSDDLIEQIHQASPPDDDGDSVFADSYKVDGVGHRAWVWVIEKDKDARSFSIEMNYELGKGGRLRKAMPRINQLLDILPSIEEELDIHCEVSFKFEGRRKAKPIIPLPMKLIESPDMPFDEIDMLHLVKRDGKRTKYDVLLSLLELGVLRETVYFDHHARIQETLADDIVKEAEIISDRFVLKGE